MPDRAIGGRLVPTVFDWPGHGGGNRGVKPVPQRSVVNVYSLRPGLNYADSALL